MRGHFEAANRAVAPTARAPPPPRGFGCHSKLLWRPIQITMALIESDTGAVEASDGAVAPAARAPPRVRLFYSRRRNIRPYPARVCAKYTYISKPWTGWSHLLHASGHSILGDETYVYCAFRPNIRKVFDEIYVYSILRPTLTDV